MEPCERLDGSQVKITEVRKPLQLPYAEVETRIQAPREVQFMKGRLVIKVEVKLPVL